MKINKYWLARVFRNEGEGDGVGGAGEPVEGGEPIEDLSGEEENPFESFLEEEVIELEDAPAADPVEDPAPAVDPGKEPLSPETPDSDPKPEGEEDPKEEPKEEPKPEPVEEPVEEPKEEPKVEAPKEEEAVKQPTEEELKAQQEKWFGELQERYKIDDADADSLLEKPETVLPKLAANIHASIMQDVLKAVPQLLQASIPNLLQQNIATIQEGMVQAESTETARNEFFEANSDLKAHPKMVMQAAQTVKTNFPDLTLKEQLKKTSQVARALLGLSPKVSEQPKADEPAPQPPFTPASPQGSSSAVPAAKGKGNEWEEFI